MENYYSWKTSKVLQRILLLIGQKQPIRGIDIAKVFDRDKSTIGHQLKWLKDEKLIIEKKIGRNKYLYLNKLSDIDKNKVIVGLTEERNTLNKIIGFLSEKSAVEIGETKNEILNLIKKNSSISLSELTEKLPYTKQTIQGHCDQLMKKGFVKGKYVINKIGRYKIYEVKEND